MKKHTLELERKQDRSLFFYLTIFPVAGILTCQPPGLGSYSMRVQSLVIMLLAYDSVSPYRRYTTPLDSLTLIALNKGGGWLGGCKKYNLV